jgi:hypothetical protein
MAKQYFTLARCSCPIPVSPYDAVTCGAPGDLVIEEGVRCQACFEEFGGTELTPEFVAAEWAGAL